MGCGYGRTKRCLGRIKRAACLLLGFWLFAGAASPSIGGAEQAKKGATPKGDSPGSRDATNKFGVLVNEPQAFQGYTLIAPNNSTTTYLLDMQGRIVHTWQSEYHPASAGYLLENGHLLRGANGNNTTLGAGLGRGGRVQQFTWEGELVWDYRCTSNKEYSHHDICKLPNGNVLLIVRRLKSPDEVIAAGGKAAVTIYVDCIQEVRPTGKTTGEVVWQWHFWDHLIQDHDKTKANHGDVDAHPERVDLNARGPEDTFAKLLKSQTELQKLRALGYVGAGVQAGRIVPDWIHLNAVAYNAQLDQIMLSTPQYGEVWIIDHSTTTAQAAGRTGGRHGKGGDLLYRWGNPRVYRAGKDEDQQLFFQHDTCWIPRGCPGAGNLLLFNNQVPAPDGQLYSSVDEIVLPVDKEGRYQHKGGTAFGPAKSRWTYAAPNTADFYSKLMGGAQRLPNGNTLICSSCTATLFEVTPNKEIVWKYLTPPLQSEAKTIALTATQTKELEMLQARVAGRIDRLLTNKQKGQYKNLQEEYKDLPLVGQIMMPFLQSKVKLTGEQTSQLLGFKKEVMRQMSKVITPEQKAHYQKMLQRAFKGGKAARIDQAVGAAFRAYRYAPTYPGLAGRVLTPGPTLEAVQAKEAKAR
jgi:hypothetical protein